MITPLGLLGSCVTDTSGITNVLDIPLGISGILASDATTPRLVVVATRAVSLSVNTPLLAGITDDAVLTAPNVCYGANHYQGYASIVGGPAFSQHSMYLNGCVLVQPLPLGSVISVAFSGFPDWMQACVLGFEGARAWVANSWLGCGFGTVCAGGCHSRISDASWASAPGGVEYAVTTVQQIHSPLVSSLTFLSGQTVENDFYDEMPGSMDISGALGDGAAGGAYDLGACTDDDTPPPGLIYGQGVGLYSGEGVAPCAATPHIDIEVGVRTGL